LDTSEKFKKRKKKKSLIIVLKASSSNNKKSEFSEIDFLYLQNCLLKIHIRGTRKKKEKKVHLTVDFFCVFST